MKNEANGNGRLELLRKREAELRAAIAAETVKRKKRELKEVERLKNIVGGVVLAASESNADLKALVLAAMQKAPLAEGESKLARAKNWL